MLVQAALEQRSMRNVAKIFRDKPDLLFRGHPVAAIEPRQTNRAGIAAQGSLAAQAEIDMEVTQGQFAKGAINRFSITAPDEVRFCDCTPMPARENVVGRRV
jgi:hypothetical protein